MKTLYNEVVETEGIEINFSILFKNIKKEKIINVYVELSDKATINHSEFFSKIIDRNKLIERFKKRKDTYVKQILETKKQYENRRTQRTRN